MTDSVTSFDHGQIVLEDLTEDNVHLVKRLNQVIFPVSYDNKFYKGLLKKEGSDTITRLAFMRGAFVGAITCRIEVTKAATAVDESLPVEGTRRNLYIMTLGCFALYRRSGIGSKLLMDAVASAGPLDAIYLHVQATNEEAVSFYQRFGFKIIETKKNFYIRVVNEKCHRNVSSHSPMDAFILEKVMTDQNLKKED